MQSIFKVFLLTTLISCNSHPNFNDDEKAKARLFIEVIALDNESNSISNSHRPNSLIASAEIQRMLELKKKARNLANQIPEQVLKKMHPTLPEYFKIYKKGLSLRIDNLENGNINTEIDGSKLLDEWADWYVQNKQEIKVPKK